MASGILGSTSKGKAKILISSSSSKGDGGGNGVPPGGGGGNGVTPGGGDGVPTGGGGGDVGGRERRMVDIVRRVRRTDQIEEEELLMSINIMSTSFGHFEGILRDFIRPPTSPPPSPSGTLSPPTGVTRSPPPPHGRTSSPPPPGGTPLPPPSPLEEEMGILPLEVEPGIPLAIKI
nr:WAS/WASL-interacting protein family member 1-like [Malus domestica]